MFTKTLLACLMAIPQLTMAAYTLSPENDYSQDFFDKFDFFTDPDPTHGFVEYVDSSTAYSSGLVKNQDGGFYIGADSTNAAPNGRQSVRLTSKAVYNDGLFVLDLAHMPGSICGTWPAFWTVGPDWPNHGEVDIIEGVNTQDTDSMTLHTGPGCSIGSQSGFTGEVTNANCDVSSGDNQGCSITNQDTSSYGSGLNNAGGAVYAAEISSGSISIWQFAPGEAPSDIAAGTPDPTTWPMPAARFSGGCDIPSHINQQQIVFDLTFCGDWAGDVWSSDSSCSSQASSCEDYVANNPSAFQDAYWQVNSLKVFTGGAGGGGGNGTYPNMTKRAAPQISSQHRSRHANHLLRHLQSRHA